MRPPNVTQQRAADLAGISRIAVQRYDQYIYENLSPKLARIYSQFDEFTPEQHVLHYESERLEKQDQAQRFLKNLPPLQVIPGVHPFTTFRKSVTSRAVGRTSRMSFSNLLAIHPATVAEYEEARRRTMPVSLVTALRGLPDAQLRLLISFGEIYYDRVNKA